jgi:hypothetical protein
MDYDEVEADDFEPLSTPRRQRHRLLAGFLTDVAAAAGRADVEAALANWPGQFARRFEDERLSCRMPDEAFGVVARARLRDALNDRIHGEGGLAEWLRARAGMTFAGPILLGESLAPVGPRLHFPALELALDDAAPAARKVRVTGTFGLAWHDAARFDLLVVNSAKRPKAVHQLNRHLLDPLLFYLALLANGQAERHGRAAADWLLHRELCIHIAWNDSIEIYPHGSDWVAPEEAREWLTGLARDVLDPAGFDLLPFELIVGDRVLRRAFEDEADDAALAQRYPELIEDAIDDAADRPFGGWSLPAVLRGVELSPPADAWAKVRRRFRLLDRGLARLRVAPEDGGDEDA